MADWDESEHPRDDRGRFRDADWATNLSDSIGAGRLFDTFIDPEFGDPSDSMYDAAKSWAGRHLRYTDRPTGYRSVPVSVEHQGDGFTVKGSFLDGRTEIGHWEVSVLKDEDGSRAGTVDGIHIDQDRRGEGLAKRFVQRMEAGMRDEDVARVSMWDHSAGFWASQGYRPGRLRGESEKML